MDGSPHRPEQKERVVMAKLIAEAYRGYYIRSNLSGFVWVEKNTALICWAKTLEDAKKKIDELLD